MKKSKTSKSFIIIDNNKVDNINDVFDKEYKTLVKDGMIIIVNAPKRGSIKKLLSYTRLAGIRREFAGIGKGMVIVAK